MTEGLTVSGADSEVHATFIQGSEFTAGATTNLGEIDVAFFFGGGSGSFSLDLHADDGTGHLGGLIESFRGIGPAAFPGDVLSVPSALHPLIAAGDTYWLIASPADAGSSVGWYLNSAGAIGTIYTSVNGEATYRDRSISEGSDRGPLALPAFRLSGGEVPEVSSLALCGLGAVGLAGVFPEVEAACS